MRNLKLSITALFLVGASACASTQRPPALSQAETIYQQLSGAGAEGRVEGDLLKAREAINQADIAVTQRKNQDYVNGLSNIALRYAQTAQANDARLLAVAALDSLRTARLNRLLTLTQSQRDQLASQNQLSQQEIDALRQRNMLVSQQADSLRNEAAQATARLNAAMSQLQTLVSEITNLKQTPRGLVVSLSDVLFDVNKATLKGGAENDVKRIAAVLGQYPDHQISVEGHTDATGSDEYNQKLSEERAASVRQALVAGGIDSTKISSKGFGKTQPVASNATPAGRQQNRRVEIVVLGASTVGQALTTGATSDSTRMKMDSTKTDSTKTDTLKMKVPPMDSAARDTTRKPPR
jgi:outer membrane protein OmpA-like peptidoglycan-associated protein